MDAAFSAKKTHDDNNSNPNNTTKNKKTKDDDDDDDPYSNRAKEQLPLIISSIGGSSIGRSLPQNNIEGEPEDAAAAGSRKSMLPKATKKKKKKKTSKDNKLTVSIRDRLLSIQYDVDHYVRPVLEKLQEKLQEKLSLSSSSESSSKQYEPSSLLIVANERCGTWYSYPFQQQYQCTETCYFKSTDGHEYNFSLKRLNLDCLDSINRNNNNNNIIYILDSSASKEIPDSLSKTIPIWATVLNRITELYRTEVGGDLIDKDSNTIGTAGSVTTFWDNQLHLPKNNQQTDNNHCNNNPVHDSSDTILMEELIQHHEITLYNSKAIVNPKWLVSTIRKPLRAFWITPSMSCTDIEQTIDNIINVYSTQYTCIVCVNCSNIALLNRPIQDFTYIPGAADDHESWCRGLTPSLFWNNIDEILSLQQQQHQQPLHQLEALSSPATTRPTIDNCNKEENSNDGGTNNSNSKVKQQEKKIISIEQKIIDRLVQQYRSEKREPSKVGNHQCCDDNQLAAEDGEDASSNNNYYDWIGQLNIAIGTRRAGRPPECWNHFDAVLNVTDVEYPNIMSMHPPNHLDEVDKNHHSQSNQEKIDYYYLQMPVREGKRDRTELEQWLSVGIIFIVHHAMYNHRKVLIHCAQGKDRSVAVVMATLQLFRCNSNQERIQSNGSCHDILRLQWKENYEKPATTTKLGCEMHTSSASTHSSCFLDSLMIFASETNTPARESDSTSSTRENKPTYYIMKDEGSLFNYTSASSISSERRKMSLHDHQEELFKFSGLPISVVRDYLGRQGRDRLLNWIQCQQEQRQRQQLIRPDSLLTATGDAFAAATATTTPLTASLVASKESLRIIFHQIRQYRVKAEPSRSTMQKLNRYFMSQEYE